MAPGFVCWRRHATKHTTAFSSVRRRCRWRAGTALGKLVVTVGSHRRLLTLPASLARLRVAGARVDDEGVLRVSFKDTATTAKERVG